MRLKYLKEHKKADYTIMLMGRTLRYNIANFNRMKSIKIAMKGMKIPVKLL